MSDTAERMRAADLEDSGDAGINPTENPTMGDMIAARFNRRDLFRGAMAVTAISATIGGPLSFVSTPPTSTPPTGLTIWRCSRCPFIICRRWRPRGCWRKAPASQTHW